MLKKNNMIVIWRIIFTYMIAIFHYDSSYGFMNELNMTTGWYIAVEFFFIVSGFLIYIQFEQSQKKCKDAISYLVYKYKKIYPYYFIILLVNYVFYLKKYEITGFFAAIHVFISHFWEVIGLHAIGLNLGWTNFNNTTWYISVLFIGSLLFFHCLQKWKETFVNFIVPIIIMVSYSYLWRNLGILDAVVMTDGFYINQPLMRGLAGMGLGVLAGRLYEYLLGRISSEGLNICKLQYISLGGFVFVIIGSLKYGRSNWDFLFSLILTVSVAIAFLPVNNRIVENKWIQKWSQLTMCIYLVHDVFRSKIAPYFLPVGCTLEEKMKFMPIYLLAISMAAVLLKVITESIMHKKET